MTLIKVVNLRKQYREAGALEVLKGIDLEIEAASSLAILGASGAGKSTLLHILGTLDRPSAGQVFFKGKDIFRYSETELSAFRNRSIGFIFQFHHLLPMLSASENVMLPALIAGVTKKLALGRANELLEQVKLAERLQHKPAELSGGEQQRVAIARALIMKPEVLFADEPTGNLDSKNGDEVADLLLQLQGDHKMTLVIVTHNQALADRLSRQIYLCDGKVMSSK